VWSRGSNRGTIVWDQTDIRLLLRLIGYAADTYEWRVLAYCVMPNHYHLLVRLPAGGLSEGMQLINGNYSRQTGKRYKRDRHLFANRFGANLADSQPYLLEVARYLPLNPVVAGLRAAPETWAWSSFAATVGLGPPPAFLAVDEIRGLFGSRPAQAAAAYRTFVMDGLVRKRQSEVSDTILRLLADLNRPAEPGHFGTASSL
jgi:putative transposase